MPRVSPGPAWWATPDEVAVAAAVGALARVDAQLSPPLLGGAFPAVSEVHG